MQENRGTYTGKAMIWSYFLREGTEINKGKAFCLGSFKQLNVSVISEFNFTEKFFFLWYLRLHSHLEFFAGTNEARKIVYAKLQLC